MQSIYTTINFTRS